MMVLWQLPFFPNTSPRQRVHSRKCLRLPALGSVEGSHSLELRSPRSSPSDQGPGAVALAPAAGTPAACLLGHSGLPGNQRNPVEWNAVSFKELLSCQHSARPSLVMFLARTIMERKCLKTGA